jgi:hypothetical protein
VKGPGDEGLKRAAKVVYFGLVALAIVLTLLLLVLVMHYFTLNSPAFGQLMFMITLIGVVVASATLTWILLGNVILAET